MFTFPDEVHFPDVLIVRFKFHDVQWMVVFGTSEGWFLCGIVFFFFQNFGRDK